jgi:hypothetical protein
LSVLDICETYSSLFSDLRVSDNWRGSYKKGCGESIFKDEADLITKNDKECRQLELEYQKKVN